MVLTLLGYKIVHRSGPVPQKQQCGFSSAMLCRMVAATRFLLLDVKRASSAFAVEMHSCCRNSAASTLIVAAVIAVLLPFSFRKPPAWRRTLIELLDVVVLRRSAFLKTTHLCLAPLPNQLWYVYAKRLRDCLHVAKVSEPALSIEQAMATYADWMSTGIPYLGSSSPDSETLLTPWRMEAFRIDGSGIAMIALASASGTSSAFSRRRLIASP
jgi:hypothetical protein